MTTHSRIWIYLCIIAMVAVPHLIIILGHWHDVPLAPDTSTGSADPDPWLRLTLVRDWLLSGNWYDHRMHQSDAPAGLIASPWTRPLDLIIAALAELQPGSIDLSTRLVRAGMLVPWIFMATLLLGLVATIRRYCPLASAQFVGVIIAANSPMLWNYFSLGYADHHSLLAASFVWLLYCVLDPEFRATSALIGGAIAGLMLWVSPESLIIIGLVYAWYGLLWLQGNLRASKFLTLLACSAAISTCIAVGIERPISQWFVAVYDSISIVHAMLMLLSALVCAILQAEAPDRLVHRLLIASMAVIVMSMVLLLTFPAIIRGPMAEVDPYIFTNFLPRVSEAQSVFTKQPLMTIGMMMQPLLALAVCAMALTKYPHIFERRIALKLGFFLVATTLLVSSQVRWYYYLYPIATLILVPAFGALLSPRTDYARGKWPTTLLEAIPGRLHAYVRSPLLLACIALPVLLPVLAPPEEDAFNKKRSHCQNTLMKIVAGGQLEQLLGGAPLNLYISTNLGGHVMFFTPYHIVASNYHREGVGMRFLDEAQAMTDESTLKKHLASRNIHALALCPEADTPSLMESWLQGKKPPTWLRPIPYRMPAPTPTEASTPAPANSAPLILRVIH